MASKNSSAASARVSITGGLTFPPGHQETIDGAQSTADMLKGLLVTIRRGAAPGKDNATQAGYNPHDRNQISAIMEEIDDTAKECRILKTDVRIAKQAALLQEENLHVGLDAIDRRDRKEAVTNVVKLIAGSSDDIQTFFRGFGIMVDSRMEPTMRRSLEDLSVHQNDRLPKESSSESRAALREALKQKNEELDKLNTKVQKLDSAWMSAMGERDRLRTELSQKASDYSREIQRKGHEARKATENHENCAASLVRSQTKVSELETEILQVRGVNSELRGQYSKLQGQFQEAGKSRLTSEAELRDLRSELQTSRRHATEMDGLRTEKEHAESRAASLERQLGESQSHLDEARKQLEAAQLEHSKDDERIKSLTAGANVAKASAEQQRLVLHGKDEKIRELEKACREKQTLITQRDRDIEERFQNTAVFLRHLSVDVDSEAWELVTQNVLVDSTRTSPALARRSTGIFSWSPDPVLRIRQDSRAPDAIALSILAIMDSKSADIKDLLTYLVGFLNAIRNNSLASAVSQLIVRAFTSAAGDPRLHFMHRIAMCQIVHLLVPAAETSLFMQSLDADDPRISRLVEALETYGPESVLENSIVFTDLVLVGLGKSPRGLLAITKTGSEICWIDESRIRAGFKTIELLTEDNSPIQLPLDDRDKFDWFVTHV
ncbi:uncharacterized protein LW94_1912 [Fusarium fujikuroi]|nr:uncharacterized protein LW94_1912 [Fusarium fujikuroi]SCO52992.1 uncharacterized protein FFMR_11311 [Fusarium fujikuroi]